MDGWGKHNNFWKLDTLIFNEFCLKNMLNTLSKIIGERGDLFRGGFIPGGIWSYPAKTGGIYSGGDLFRGGFDPFPKEWNHVYTIPYQRNTATTSRQEKTIQVPSKSIQRPKAKAFWTVFRIHKIRTRGIIQFGLLHGNEAIGVPQCVITCFLFRRCASKIGGAAYKAS